ncbi:ribosomal protein S18 acetylase RimI-like enzyme [Micromonospora vinacea]|uniref:Ribosomal protein S18 acetylase RimI-like enzyme n=1 Tax=Micromonospora vinacea TaxID=709878 RepID=A0ABS0KCT6_9ACTN|nr:GNAT family N-acetyltransferase [Micromonospora vinacea]MBG6105998.1 ribosomal protein S18 acetylase RimI-like enzyme [Micromonospora vinacea]
MTKYSIHDLEPQLAANRRYWCGWAGARPDTDLPTYRTDIPHPLLNGVLRVRGRQLDDAIAEVKRHLTGSRWGWWVGADSDEGTAEGLLERGAEQIGDMPIMAVDVTTVAEAAAPADLKIRTVVGPVGMREYVAAYAGPLGISGDLGIVVDRELGFAYPDVLRLAGTVDGRTVGTCTLSLGTDVGALYCIATDPAFRRRGIATALTCEALRITRESGRRIATLQASAEGEPVYRQIGFDTVARYRLYQLPE